MASLWWNQSALDDLIERATSELLPTQQEDVALHFEISDQIRGKKVKARDAMRAMKRRLFHKNPNVQLVTLSLIDTCVKNAGEQFVREIASREFMDEISSLLQPTSNTNIEVRKKALSVIQTWALAAKNNLSLSYLTDSYQLLKAEGHVFPPVTEPVDPILLETAIAPEWTDSDVCERCRTPFTFTNRKHHCRNCGGTYCHECSSKTQPLPHLAINEEVRVCYGCYVRLKLSKVAKKDDLPPQPGSSASNAPRYSQAEEASTDQTKLRTNGKGESGIGNSKTEDEQFEQDIQKAIELSLQDERKTGYVSHGVLSSSNNKRAPETTAEDEDDPDLAAAIQASLRDMENAKAPLPYDPSQYTLRVRNDELSETERENIELFSVLMERIKNSQGNAVEDRQVDELYTKIGTLQPKLVKSLNEITKKYQTFAELHDKLNSALRSYDRMLEQRIAQSYQRTSIGADLTRHGSSNYQHSSGTWVANNPVAPATPIQSVASLYPNFSPSQTAQYTSHQSYAASYAQSPVIAKQPVYYTTSTNTNVERAASPMTPSASYPSVSMYSPQYNSPNHMTPNATVPVQPYVYPEVPTAAPQSSVPPYHQPQQDVPRAEEAPLIDL